MSAVPDAKTDRYYTYDDVVSFLKGCADAAGDVFTLHSIATTPEGRDVWLATITDPSTGSAESKPAYYVQGNVHAQEWAATTASIQFIHTLLTDPQARELLRTMTFYVIPRANPDGTEYAMTTCGGIRSRNEIMPDVRNGLVPQDLNGDGLIMQMRIEDPAGALTEDPEDPRILVPRRPGDTGPFYRTYDEGMIQNYDGGPITSAVKGYDFNRDYPANWDYQTDRADRPALHPEMAAIVDFLMERKNIFAGVDFHCGSNAILRPCTRPDGEMNQSDLGLVLEVGKIAEQITGFPLMNARDYRLTWTQPSVLRGNSNDFAYFMLGISWYVCELGNGYSTSGITIDEYFGSEPEERERDFMRRIMKYADEHPETRDIFVPWQSFDHPQLGKVEIGGLKPASIYHLDPVTMKEIGARTTQFLLTHASWRPEICISNVQADCIGEGVYRIRATVANTGRFATNVMTTGASPSCRTLTPVVATIDGLADEAIVSCPRTYEFTGLAGGGGGPQLEWFITATPGDEITLTASHPRGGTAKQTLTLP